MKKKILDTMIRCNLFSFKKSLELNLAEYFSELKKNFQMIKFDW